MIDLDMPKCCAYVDDILIMNTPQMIDNKKEEKEEEGLTEDETQLLAFLKYANATYFQTPLKY